MGVTFWKMADLLNWLRQSWSKPCSPWGEHNQSRQQSDYSLQIHCWSREFLGLASTLRWRTLAISWRKAWCEHKCEVKPNSTLTGTADIIQLHFCITRQCIAITQLWYVDFQWWDPPTRGLQVLQTHLWYLRKSRSGKNIIWKTNAVDASLRKVACTSTTALGGPTGGSVKWYWFCFLHRATRCMNQMKGDNEGPAKLGKLPQMPQVSTFPSVFFDIKSGHSLLQSFPPICGFSSLVVGPPRSVCPKQFQPSPHIDSIPVIPPLLKQPTPFHSKFWGIPKHLVLVPSSTCAVVFRGVPPLCPASQQGLTHDQRGEHFRPCSPSPLEAPLSSITARFWTQSQDGAV